MSLKMFHEPVVISLTKFHCPRLEGTSQNRYWIEWMKLCRFCALHWKRHPYQEARTYQFDKTFPIITSFTVNLQIYLRSAVLLNFNWTVLPGQLSFWKCFIFLLFKNYFLCGTNLWIEFSESAHNSAKTSREREIIWNIRVPLWFSIWDSFFLCDTRRDERNCLHRFFFVVVWSEVASSCSVFGYMEVWQYSLYIPRQWHCQAFLLKYWEFSLALDKIWPFSCRATSSSPLHLRWHLFGIPRVVPRFDRVHDRAENGNRDRQMFYLLLID